MAGFVNTFFEERLDQLFSLADEAALITAAIEATLPPALAARLAQTRARI